MHSSYDAVMTVITVRDVPDEVRDELAARAGRSGMSMQEFIRAHLIDNFGDHGSRTRILYGGSVKADNAAELFAVDNVDGALVGGASLTAGLFVPIIQAAARG